MSAALRGLRCAALLAAVVLAAAAGGCREERVEGRPVGAWAAELRDTSPAVRMRAARTLAHAAPQSPRAVDLLLAALEDPRLGPLHDTLATALAGVGPRAAAAVVPRLVLQARDPHADVRRGAIEALGRVGAVSPEVAPALARALADPDHEVRIAAVDAVRAIGPPARGASAALAAATRDPISYVRLGAVDALDKVGAPADVAVPALVAALRSDDSDVRARAADALRWRGKVAAAVAPDAVPALTAALRDPSADVRAAAALALGSLGPRAHTALSALVRLRDDPDSAVRGSARDALEALRR